MSKLLPKYTFWDAINVAIALGTQALDEIRALARIPGPAGRDGADGKDGRDGRDGAGFDDINEWLEDEGRITVRQYLAGGKVFKEFRHPNRNQIYRGVFDDARLYLPGDTVTWKGSLWHCNSDVKGKIGSENWTLCVKKGADGKDGQ